MQESSSPGTPDAAKALKTLSFIPALYFLQAIPVTVVQELSEVIFKDLKVENGPITLWTSLIALPWTLKILWGPVIDLNSTRRDWSMKLMWAIAACLIGVAFALRLPNAFSVAVGVMAITAIFSATCDIATDGYYLLALSKEQQAANVGVQSMFYRLGRVFVMGAIIQIAGRLQKSGVETMSAWTYVLLICAVIYAGLRLFVGKTAPIAEKDVRRSQTAQQNLQNAGRVLVVVAIGLTSYFFLNSVVRLGANAINSAASGKFGGWVLTHDQLSVEWIQLALCGLGVAVSVGAAKRLLRGTEMAASFQSFVFQPRFVGILLFLTLYRFGEAMVGRIAPLFLKDSVAKGGLAIPNEVLGAITGYSGVIGLVCGGLVGGAVVSRFGLKRCFWPIAILMHLPHLGYIWASYAKPAWILMHPVAFLDNFGYGFGYAAYVVYLQRIAQRDPRYQTAHYAIGTGLGAMCISVAGIFSGTVQTNFGYSTLFWIALGCAIPGALTLLWLPQVED